MPDTETTFMQKCLAGEAVPDDIDDFVDRWHDGGGSGESLAEFLGFTDDEYKRWAEEPMALPSILEERKAADQFWEDIAGPLRRAMGFAVPTPEEAEAAYQAAPAVPLSASRIKEIVRFATQGGEGVGHD
jgi:hypothetical protein